MRRSALAVLVVALAGIGAGCGAATPARAPGPAREDSSREAPIAGDAAHGRPPESRGQAVPVEAERSVVLPDSVELVASPSLPERPRIAVVFVRGGKLVRRPDALRKLAHDFTNEGRIEALEKFAEDAPSSLTLAHLCERAERQGALLLLVDARATDDDADRTTFVLSTAFPHRALAFTRPKAAAPAGTELVARLVRTSRGAF